MLFSAATVITGKEDGQGQSPAQPHLSHFRGWMSSEWGHPSRDSASSHPPQIIENCPVTGIQVRADDFGVKRVHAVETAHGTIQTPCVVNCAGTGRLAEPLCLVPCGLGCWGAAPSPVPLPPPLTATPDGLCVPAGVWARALGQLAGVHVPLVAMHHAYVVTERIEGIQVGREAGQPPRDPPAGPPPSCPSAQTWARLCRHPTASPGS